MRSVFTRWLRGGIVASGFALAIAPAAFAVETPLSDDAYTASSAPAAQLGRKPSLAAANGRTAFMKFDMSALPPGTAGSDVIQATLRVFVRKVLTPGTFDVVSVMDDWNEQVIT